jgi:tryptophan 2,3-dioxygenase
MLNGEHEQKEPLTYGSYLRVPELLSLQTQLGPPDARDEMLFIVVQQAQELWFKQILHELSRVVGLLGGGELAEAVRLIRRVNQILGVLTDEVIVLETMPPGEFHKFRHVLVMSSGFESEQFRELELASGLEDPTFLKVMAKYIDLDAARLRWKQTLRTAFLGCLEGIDRDPVNALVRIYDEPTRNPELFALAEVLSEYEVGFAAWRFHHIKLVQRTIGDHVPGTAGSSGVGYLGKTLTYYFFPELWEARNRLTAMHTKPPTPVGG